MVPFRGRARDARRECFAYTYIHENIHTYLALYATTDGTVIHMFSNKVVVLLPYYHPTVTFPSTIPYNAISS